MLETKWDKIDLFGLCGKGNLAQGRIWKGSPLWRSVDTSYIEV